MSRSSDPFSATPPNDVANHFGSAVNSTHMNRRLRRVLIAAFGIGVGAATYEFLVANLALATTNASLSAVGVELTARNRAALRDLFDDSQRDGPNWWDGAVGPLVIVAGLFGLGPTLGLSGELRYALAVLVVGTILVAWNLGIGTVLWRLEADGGDGM